MLAPGQQDNFKAEVMEAAAEVKSSEEVVEEVSDVEAEEASIKVVEVLDALESIIMLYNHLDSAGLVEKSAEVPSNIELPEVVGKASV